MSRGVELESLGVSTGSLGVTIESPGVRIESLGVQLGSLSPENGSTDWLEVGLSGIPDSNKLLTVDTVFGLGSSSVGISPLKLDTLTPASSLSISFSEGRDSGGGFSMSIMSSRANLTSGAKMWTSRGDLAGELGLSHFRSMCRSETGRIGTGGTFLRPIDSTLLARSFGLLSIGRPLSCR